MDPETQVVDDSDADFEAGFNAVRGGESAPKSQPDPQASEQSAQSKPETDTSTEQDAEPGISNADGSTGTVFEQKDPTTRELLSRIDQLQNTVRNIAGNFGGLKSELQRELREISRLQQVREAEPQGSPAAEGARKTQQLILKRVKENWPDFADDLAADLSETIGAAKAAPTFNPMEIEQRVSQRVSQEVNTVEQRLSAETLEVLLPDWQATISTRDTNGNLVKDSTGRYIPSREFMSWLQSKGPDFEGQFWSTNSPKFLIGAIREFKSALDGSKGNNKQARLKSAVVPQGRGGAAPQAELDEEALMNRGFASIRGAFR